MAHEAKSMRRLSLELDAIVTSPLLRAKQTAEIVADALKMHHRLVADERLGLGFSIEGLAGMLQDHHDAEALMLVGHEPSMSATIGRLVGGARLDLKKGGLARIDLPNTSSLQGRLMWLVPPKILAR
jgi:phosphohistidine phosphatase